MQFNNRLGTWSAELSYRRGSGLVIDSGERAALRDHPCAGPAVSLLRRIIHLHMRRPLCQVLTVMTQAILSYLDSIEIPLRAPLGGQRYSCKEETENKYKRLGVNLKRKKQKMY